MKRNNQIKNNRLSVVFAVMILSGLFLSCANKASDESHIEISSSEQSVRTITLQDIVLRREIEEQQISPDGKKVAIIVKQASIDENRYYYALYIQDVNSGHIPKKYAEFKDISNLRWTPDGSSLTYLSSSKGVNQIWIRNIDTNRTDLLFTHLQSISKYEYSTHGKKIAFLSQASVTEEEIQQEADKGILYRDHYDFLNIVKRNWISKPYELWIFDKKSNSQEKIWTQETSISAFSWSHSDEYIALEYYPSNKAEDRYQRDIGIYDFAKKEIVPIVTTTSYDRNPIWSPDDRYLVFTSRALGKKRNKYGSYSLFTLDMNTREKTEILKDTSIPSSSKIWWPSEERKVFLVMDNRQRSALYQVSLSDGMLQKVFETNDHISDFAFDQKGQYCSCICQNPNTPPEIAVSSLEDKSLSIQTELNPEFKHILRGQVEDISWENEYGQTTNGFLIKPINMEKGEKYPFLLMLYGFSGEFIADAQWITSYPVQYYAANDYVVLMMNYPYYTGKDLKGQRAALVNKIYNPLRSIEKAVEIVDDMGIIDIHKKGIMGLSYGSFLTDYTITHTNLFECASSTDGGLYNPGRYWMSTAGYQYNVDGVYGGPLFYDAFEQYQLIAPAFNADKVQAPVLMEYAKRIYGLEFYTALKKQQVPVELIFYPDEPHSFLQPKHRMASMEKNFDWFEYWLLGKKDPDESKLEQYQRWDSMKERFESKRKMVGISQNR
ncbi:MAG: prolyl oligopeptidase family serine peptidase [Bacteroidota bacterium]